MKKPKDGEMSLRKDDHALSSTEASRAVREITGRLTALEALFRTLPEMIGRAVADAMRRPQYSGPPVRVSVADPAKTNLAEEYGEARKKTWPKGGPFLCPTCGAKGMDGVVQHTWDCKDGVAGG